MNKQHIRFLIVLCGFFVMGFCDVVGIATSYVKETFHLNETLAGFIPSMVFIWFLLLSLPAALAMNRIGRKRMVQWSNLITLTGMLLPAIDYSLATCMTAFALLGIGNTLLQVSLNPLVASIIAPERLSSSLTAGQVIKATSSFCGPFIAMFAADMLGDWRYLFPIFAGITLLWTVWLQLTPVHEASAALSARSPAKASFGLLREREMLGFFLCIFFIVGVDVGMNTVAPKLLIERCAMPVEEAGIGSSLYFLCRTAGAMAGTALLMRMNDIRYLRTHLCAALLFMTALYFASQTWNILLLTGLIGFSCSSVFSVIYSLALKSRPDQSNEISGLLITGICGGAVIPPAMGIAADLLHGQNGSLLIITLCLIYLCVKAFRLGRETNGRSS